MKPEAKKLWGSKQGGSLMEAMLQGRSLTADEKATLERLKKLDPPAVLQMAPQTD